MGVGVLGIGHVRVLPFRVLAFVALANLEYGTLEAPCRPWGEFKTLCRLSDPRSNGIGPGA